MKTKLFLAPMAGYTDLPFRLLAQKNGADIGISEMISAKGLYYKDKKTASLFQTDKEEKNLGLQIFGSEPKFLKEAVNILKEKKETNETNFSFIDFNAGCPAPKIVKNGDGSALLKDLVLLRDCVSAIKETSNVPVSVKTRIGFNENENIILDIVRALEEGGADLITIHPRTRSQFYSGSADWNVIPEVKKITNLPICLSGDITSPEKAKMALEIGADHLMIGRAAVENPYIFTQIKDYLQTGTYQDNDIQKRIENVTNHLDLTLKYKKSESAIIALRKHLASYTKGLPGAGTLRKKIFETKNPEEVRYLFENLL